MLVAGDLARLYGLDLAHAMGRIYRDVADLEFLVQSRALLRHVPSL